jgi:hypothetical protein
MMRQLEKASDEAGILPEEPTKSVKSVWEGLAFWELHGSMPSIKREYARGQFQLNAGCWISMSFGGVPHDERIR